jgi:predicted Fe-Mo cluster-binding NifX family protein
MKQFLMWALSVSLLFSGWAVAAEKNVGKIAVASDEKTITGAVGSRMGRSALYLLFDGKGKFLEAIDNPFKDAGGRSGKSSLDSLRFDEKGGLTGGIETPSKEEREKIWDSLLGFLAAKGITVVVAEQFGYEIIRVMKERGITYVEFKGRSVDAVKKACNLQKKIK